MAESNGKTLAAWITIAVTVVVVFATQAINADVRNRERDEVQDEKISTIQADVREINTKLAYIEKGVSAQQVLSERILEAVKK